MTRALRLPRDVTKEIRALLPTWVACMIALGAAAVFRDPIYRLGLFAYVLGSIALGAQSMGHEYTHRTLTLLLSQPVSRVRLFLVKLAVLTPMLLILAAVAWGTVFHPHQVVLARYWTATGRVTVLTTTLLGSLCLAPLITMACRNPLAGVIFTIVTPGLLLIFSRLLTVVQFGHTGPPDADRFEIVVFRWSVLGCCAVAAVLSWRMFSGLEAIDGRDPEVQLPRWLRARTATIASAPAAPARLQSPYWLLVKKELHLQQMTFVVAGIYVSGFATLALIGPIVPGFSGRAVGLLTILYSGMLAVLIGAFASAEERHVGMLESQVLLPMAMWKQWAVKVATALSLVLLLVFGLPLLLSTVLPAADQVRVTAASAGTIIFGTFVSLYVSSLCASGVRAMLLSFLVLFGLVVVANRFGAGVFLDPRLPSLLLVGLAGSAALALRFGLVNHRSAERGAGRVWRQAIWIGGCLTIGVTALAALSRLD